MKTRRLTVQELFDEAIVATHAAFLHSTTCTVQSPECPECAALEEKRADALRTYYKAAGISGTGVTED